MIKFPLFGNTYVRAVKTPNSNYPVNFSPVCTIPGIGSTAVRLDGAVANPLMEFIRRDYIIY